MKKVVALSREKRRHTIERGGRGRERKKEKVKVKEKEICNTFMCKSEVPALQPQEGCVESMIPSHRVQQQQQNGTKKSSSSSKTNER